MRRISELLEANGRIWFFIDDSYKDRFYDELIQMGARFANGEPVERGAISRFMGVGADKSVGHVSAMVWFRSFSHPGIPVKVDYENYTRGEEEYIITE